MKAAQDFRVRISVSRWQHLLQNLGITLTHFVLAAIFFFLNQLFCEFDGIKFLEFINWTPFTYASMFQNKHTLC